MKSNKRNKPIAFLKKFMISSILVLTFFVSSIMMGDIEAQAAWEEEDMDVSYLMLESSLIGYAERQTRGVYLLEGWSSINDAGFWKIGCGGITNAAMECHVGITAIVERKVDGSWARVKSWSAESDYDITVSVSKYLAIVPGYYYRVRCTHYAETDVSTSFTNSLWK